MPPPSKSELPIVLVGDSAGGNLCATVCHAMRGQKHEPIGQIAVYPGYGDDSSKGSYLEHANAPMLTVADIQFYAGVRTGGKKVTGDPTLSPLQDIDFSGLPPTAVFSAECDPLCDDGRDYCDAIVAAGGRAKWFRETGLVHGYLRARHTVNAPATVSRVSDRRRSRRGEGRGSIEETAWPSSSPGFVAPEPLQYGRRELHWSITISDFGPLSPK